MPIYEYVCQDCENTYEHLVRSSAERVECPKCGSGRKKLQFSTFSSPKPAGAAESSTSSASSCACTPRSCGCH
ncbi:MAG TPA: zinc ribbon domain-containing protein [Candidatus Binatia bacterium]|nr:zinc ribbon domain-containing protein [Candidatus Binatia bacterium]